MFWFFVRRGRALFLLTLIFFIGASFHIPLRAQDRLQIMCSSLFSKNFGQWIPIQVTLTNNGPLIKGQLTLEDSDPYSGHGGIAAVYQKEVELPANETRSFFFYYQKSGCQGLYPLLKLTQGNETILQEQLNINKILGSRYENYDTNIFNVLVISSARGSFNLPTKTAKYKGQERNISVYITDKDALPPQWMGLDNVDMLIIHDVPLENLSDQQLEAIGDWLYRGGRLILSYQSLSHFQPSFLRGRRISPETSNEPFDILIIGQGRVYIPSSFVEERFFNEQDPTLWAIPLSIQHPEPSPEKGLSYLTWESPPLSRILAPSTIAVFLYLLLFFLIVGPFNYFLLRRKGRKEMLLVTIPVISLVFSLTAFLWATWMKGHDNILTTFSCITLYQGDKEATCSTYGSFFAGKKNIYQLNFADGRGCGYVFDRDFNRKKIKPYEICEDGGWSIYFPQNQWTLKSFIFESIVRLPGTISGELSFAGYEEPILKMKNDTGYHLTNCYLSLPEATYSMRDIPPGEHVVEANTEDLQTPGNLDYKSAVLQRMNKDMNYSYPNNGTSQYPIIWAYCDERPVGISLEQFPCKRHVLTLFEIRLRPLHD
ncbi:MAG: hypothetical protein V2A78_11570 [bacterium]